MLPLLYLLNYVSAEMPGVQTAFSFIATQILPITAHK